MKKHLLSIAAVFVILAAVYVIGHQATAPATISAPHIIHKAPAKPKPSVETNSKPPTTPTIDKSQFSTTDPQSIWVVVNKHRPLSPIDYSPTDLVSVGAGQYMRAAAGNALTSMLNGAATAGYSVTPASGYRSYSTQVSVYNSEVKNYGQQVADTESARPGYSEHQSGLAMDLASGGCSITDCFGNTPGGRWVTAHAYEYGFILRYPQNKTAITGYRTETWHFRYVGVALATEMHKQDIQTLEEFFGLEAAPNYE